MFPDIQMTRSSHDRSGTHPFDYGKVKGESEYYSHNPSEAGDDSQYSQESWATDQLVKRRIVHGEVEFPSHSWDRMPQGESTRSTTSNTFDCNLEYVVLYSARELCGNLLIYDAMERATAQTALRSSWFTAELLDLELAYRSRISSD